MQNKISEKAKSFKSKRFVIAIALVLLLIIAPVIIWLLPPERSVASYCKIYKEEKARLVKLPGDTYPSGVFDDALSDANEFTQAFGKLEKVAPDEIRSDVKNLQGIYKKMNDDPSQTVGASLSGIGAEQSVKSWTTDHCK